MSTHNVASTPARPDGPMASRAAPPHASVGHLDDPRVASIENEIKRIAEYLGRGDRRVGPQGLLDRGRESATGFVGVASQGAAQQSSAPVLRSPRRLDAGDMGQRRPKGRDRDGKVDVTKVIGWAVFAGSAAFAVIMVA